MSKKKFVTRVIDFLQGGEEACVTANVKAIRKEWSTQITNAKRTQEANTRVAKEAISDQKERVQEAKDSLTETFLMVSAEKYTIDERKEYVSSYEKKVANAMAIVDREKDKLASLEEELSKSNNDIENSIKFYTEALAAIEDTKE